MAWHDRAWRVRKNKRNRRYNFLFSIQFLCRWDKSKEDEAQKFCEKKITKTNGSFESSRIYKQTVTNACFRLMISNPSQTHVFRSRICGIWSHNYNAHYITFSDFFFHSFVHRFDSFLLRRRSSSLLLLLLPQSTQCACNAQKLFSYFNCFTQFRSFSNIIQCLVDLDYIFFFFFVVFVGLVWFVCSFVSSVCRLIILAHSLITFNIAFVTVCFKRSFFRSVSWNLGKHRKRISTEHCTLILSILDKYLPPNTNVNIQC